MAMRRFQNAAYTAESVASLYDRFKPQKKEDEEDEKAKKLARVEDVDLIDTKKYAADMEAEEAQKKRLEDAGIALNEKGEPIEKQPIDLDEFLKARKAAKSREFKRLQMEQGFYFSEAMNDAVLHEMRANEGYYLIGVNFNALFDLFNYSIYNKGEPLYDEEGNPVGVPKGDVLKDGDSMALIGEWIDKGREYDKLLKDVVGLRLGPTTVLKPEDVLNEKSRFRDIIEESMRYTGMTRKYLNPTALHNMVRILDKYKKSEVQWLRAATALEIVYQYMSRGSTRELFFASRTPLDEGAILELDEFFKTDHLFMTLSEITQLKKDLEFYRFMPNTKPTATNNNTKPVNNTKPPTATNNNTKPVNNFI